ncbi:MAG: AsmA-like C-terminal region-containing protein [Bacteroidales bacterium]|nr:AsmA-like C-terminal region-containing protein [Bacteroidales bacterium]
MNDNYAVLRMQGYVFDGELVTSSLQKCDFYTCIDSLTLEGHTQKDSLFFTLDHFRVNGKKGDMDLDISANTLVATKEFGRLLLPVSVTGKALAGSRVFGGMDMELQDVSVKLATISFNTDMKMSLDGKLFLDGKMDISPIDVQYFLDNYLSRFSEAAAKVKTDMVVDASVEVKGEYSPKRGTIPEFSALLNIPRCYLSYQGVDIVPHLELETRVSGTKNGRMDASVSRLKLDGSGLDLGLTGDFRDLAGAEPKADVDCKAKIRLDSLGNVLAGMTGIFIGGNLDMDVNGSCNLSGANIIDSDLKGYVTVKDVVFNSIYDHLLAKVDELSLKLALMDERFKEDSKGRDMSMGARLELKNVDAAYAGTAKALVKDIRLELMKSTDKMSADDTLRFQPLRAGLHIGDVDAVVMDSMDVKLNGIEGKFALGPSKENRRMPLLNAGFDIKHVRAQNGANRADVNGIKIDLGAKWSALFKKRRFSTIMDSLHAVNPASAPDSMWRFLVNHPKEPKLPYFMSNGKHKDDDPNAFLRKYKKWDFNAGVSVDKVWGTALAFPLAARIDGLELSVSNDALALDKLRLGVGDSRLAVEGALSNLKGALLNKESVKLNLAVDSDTLAIDQVYKALEAGHLMNGKAPKETRSADDGKLEQILLGKVEKVDSLNHLIVLPDMVDANISVRTKGASFLNLKIRDISADLKVKDRVLQLANTRIRTNTGNIGMEAFYSTREKGKADVGFDMELENLQIGEALSIVPKLDTLAPIVKSLEGRLNVNMSATTQLDKTSSIKDSTMNAVLRVVGDSIYFSNNRTVSTIAALLWTRNASHATISHLDIEAIVKNNRLELFPFALKLENWELVAAGTQSLSGDFNYHISLVKCPFGLRLGANIFGDNFHKVKFKMGKSKYRNLNVPSYADEIEKTRAVLVKNIHSVFDIGPSNAMNNHNELRYMREARSRNSYNSSVAEAELEEMSDAEKAVVEKLNM